MLYYDLLLEKGYKYEELYQMTLKELSNGLKMANKGLSYKMFKQAYLIGVAFGGKFPKTPEEANPELYPPKKRYKMNDWVKQRYYKQEGVKIDEQ